MRRTAEIEGDQAVVAADTVIVVDHEIAFAECRELGDELVGPPGPARWPAQPVALNVGFGEQRAVDGGEAVLEGQDGKGRAGRGPTSCQCSTRCRPPTP